MLLTSEALFERIDEILNIPVNNTFKLTLELFNDDNPDFEIEFAVIHKFELVQNFFDNIIDKAFITFMCPVRDAILINDNQIGLKAKIKITYTVHTTIEDDEEQEIEEYEYNAFIENLVDFNKFFNTELIISEETNREKLRSSMLPISLTLLNETGFLARRAYFQGQFTETTIAKVIQFTAVTLGLKKLHFIEPDNPTEYMNIYIHPEFGRFDTLIPYLQERFGIYSQGVTFYVAEDVLFIYPSYDMYTPRKYNLTILKIPEGLYAGMKNYHEIEEDTLTIVSNTSMLTKPIHNEKSMNEGNSIAYLQADAMIDNVIIQKECEFEVQDIVTSIVDEESFLIDKEGLQPKYNKPLLNNLKPMSEVADGSFDITKVGWQLARLYSIKPYTLIEMHYDSGSEEEGDKSVKTTTGIPISVKYTYLRPESSGSEAIGVFNAEISMFVKPHTSTRDAPQSAPAIKAEHTKKVFEHKSEAPPPKAPPVIAKPIYV